MVTHGYIGEGGSKGEAHAQTFNLLIVDARKEEKRIEYSVLEELGEELLSEALDKLVLYGIVCL